MDITSVGVDLAKNFFVACVADCAGRIVERREFNRGGLSDLARHPAGRHGEWYMNPLAPRMGRNPKTGQQVFVPAKHRPHFKPGKALRERVACAQG